MVVPTILGLVAIAAVVLLVVLFVMRSGAAEVTRTEHHLEEPGTPTVTYDLPEGVDPVVVGTELRNAGFTSLPKLEADSQRLVVECGEDDRGRVREVIAEVHRTAYGYDFTADEVVFEEER